MYRVAGKHTAVGFYHSKTTPIIVIFGPHRSVIEQLFTLTAQADQRIAAARKSNADRLKKLEGQ